MSAFIRSGRMQSLSLSQQFILNLYSDFPSHGRRTPIATQCCLLFHSKCLYVYPICVYMYIRHFQKPVFNGLLNWLVRIAIRCVVHFTIHLATTVAVQDFGLGEDVNLTVAVQDFGLGEDVNLTGGFQLPMRLWFTKLTCQNERIGSLGCYVWNYPA